jgi:hypothetical protein
MEVLLLYEKMVWPTKTDEADKKVKMCLEIPVSADQETI